MSASVETSGQLLKQVFAQTFRNKVLSIATIPRPTQEIIIASTGDDLSSFTLEKAVFVLDGGGARCGVQNGELAPFVKRRIFQEKNENIILSASAGAINALYAIADRSETGEGVDRAGEILTEDIAHGFINYRHILQGALNATGLENFIRNVKPPINMDALADASTRVKVATSRRRDGHAMITEINGAQRPDAIDYVVASTLLPGLANRRGIILDDRQLHVDGGIGSPTLGPVALHDLDATEVVFLMANPSTENGTAWQRFVTEVLMYKYGTAIRMLPFALRRSIQTMTSRYNEEVREIMQHEHLTPAGKKMKVAIIFPASLPISSLSRDTTLLKEGRAAGYEFVENLLARRSLHLTPTPSC